MELKVDHTMSRHPETVRFKDDLFAAFVRMKREGFRHMPVIDDLGKVIGIISDRDFQRAMLPLEGPDADGYPETPIFKKGAKVSDFMSWPVRSLPENTDLLTAVETMIQQKISSLVVTRDGYLCGIVTTEDLLRVLATLLKEPPSIKHRALSLVYNTPLGKVTEMLSTAGI